MKTSSLLAAGAAVALSSIGSFAAREPGEGQMRQRARVSERQNTTRSIPRSVMPNLPGETNRQFAQRMRAEAANTTVEAPAKPKRVRTKKVVA